MSLVSSFKGWIGEKAAQFGMWVKLDQNIYKRYHNVIIQTKNGTTQTDHVLLSVYGLFVIETKNYNGWIYGDEKQKYWTQVLFKKKSKFQNPLHQNYKHTKSLAEYLHTDHRNIYSIVFFIGDDVKLKTELPPNVMSSGLSAYIRSFDKAVFDYSEIQKFEHQLKDNKKNQNIFSSYNHVKNVKNRYSSNIKCPKCGGELTERVAKKGQYSGEKFSGCSNYPKCRYIKTGRKYDRS
ncbi:MAG: NERD domain-containing protein [Desulfobacterales bacterium]|nr:NERD domain-containing protein [Desulfobacterales bacterium]